MPRSDEIEDHINRQLEWISYLEAALRSGNPDVMQSDIDDENKFLSKLIVDLCDVEFLEELAREDLHNY